MKKTSGIVALVFVMVLILSSIPAFAAPMTDHGPGAHGAAMPDGQMMTSEQMMKMSKEDMVAMCKDQMMVMMNKMMMHRMMSMMTDDQTKAVTESLMGEKMLHHKMLAVGEHEKWMSMPKDQWMMNMRKAMMGMNKDEMMKASDKMMENMTKDQLMMMHNMHNMMMNRPMMCM